LSYAGTKNDIIFKNNLKELEPTSRLNGITATRSANAKSAAERSEALLI